MTEYLFSYGTLQKEDVQNKLFGRCLNGSRDTLAGYKVIPVEVRDEVFLSTGERPVQRTATVSDTDAVQGTVLEVSEQELAMADGYEPAEFKRVSVTLVSGKEAWIYIADGAA